MADESSEAVHKCTVCTADVPTPPNPYGPDKRAAVQVRCPNYHWQTIHLGPPETFQ